MGKSAGVITININAGTAQLVQDLDKAKAKVADFTSQGVRGFQQLGEHSVSSMQATSGGLRLLEGNFQNNIRASERFIATTLGLGPAIQAAFPLVGGLAFGGMISEIGVKVYEFFKKIESAPERISGAFREMNAPMRATNDELIVSIDRIQMELDKLQGKRTNNVKLELDEAKLAADNLTDSLDKALSSMNKVLKEQNVGFLGGLASGQKSTTDIEQYFGGLTGQGGFRARVNAITETANRQIGEARDKGVKKVPGFDAAAEEKKIRDEANIKLAKEYAEALKFVNTELAKTNQLSVGKAFTVKPGVAEISRREILQGLVSPIENQTLLPGLLAQKQDVTAKKEAQISANDNAKMARPFEDRIKAMKAQLEDLKAKLASVGQTDAFRAITEGHGNAIKIIAEVNKALEQYHRALTPAQKAEIDALAIQSKQTEIETAYRTKLDSTTRSIEERITAAQALTAAIGRGYEATKAATVETQLATAMGREYNDAARSADQASLRSKLSAEFEARHRQEITATLDKLGDQIELEKALSAVQYQGAEAVRQAELAYRLDQIAKNNDAESTKKLQAAEKELYAATQANHSAATVAKIADETAALKRLTAAALEGAEAVRKAGSANQFADLAKKGGTPVPGMIGVSQEQLASAGQEQAQHETEITDTASRRVNIYKDHLSSLNEQLSVLKEYKAKNADNLQVDIAIRDIENEKLNLLAQQYLATGKLSDGMKAFFLESAANARKPGQILHDGLDHAVDGVSEELSKVMAGQHADWGRMMQSLGQGMLKDSLKSGMQQGLGALGKALHIPGMKDLGLAAEKKVTFRAGDPGHVIVDNMPGDGASIKSFVDHSAPVPTIASTILGYAAPVAGGVAGGMAGPGFTSDSKISYGGEAVSPASTSQGNYSLGFTPRADGGLVSPDKAYWVGEHGPESFVPRTHGTVIPNEAFKGFGGMVQHIWNVDAKGADLGAGNRVRQALAAVHKRAVIDATQVIEERSQRTPR